MVAQLPRISRNLYELDYNLWVLETAKQLEAQDFDGLDWAALPTLRLKMYKKIPFDNITNAESLATKGISKFYHPLLGRADWANLLEEEKDLSQRYKNKLESLLVRLFEHLLKLTYWHSEIDRNRGHWEGEIINFLDPDWLT